MFSVTYNSWTIEDCIFIRHRVAVRYVKSTVTHIFTWWNGGYYYSSQQASGLLAPVFSRYDGRSAKDHYSFQSHDLHQHMQVLNSWQQIQSRKDYSQLRLRPPPPPKDYLPQNERQWLGIFYDDLWPSTDNAHLSSRPKLEALPLLIYTLGKESFRGSEEP